MHKIDAPHATASNGFTDGNPALGIEATELVTLVQHTGFMNRGR